MHNLSPKVFLASLACAFASPTFAQEAARQGLSLSLGTGVDQTDNAFKTSVRERSETKEYLDLDVGFLRDSEYLTTTAQYSAELANYENDTTEQKSLLTGSTKLAWKLLPGRVQVDLSHDRSEQMRDSRNPDIRNNRELRDIISAGPRFMARLSPAFRYSSRCSNEDMMSWAAGAAPYRCEPAQELRQIVTTSGSPAARSPS